MRQRAEGTMARGKRRQREEVAEEPDVDLEERYDECRKSPLICLATQDEEY